MPLPAAVTILETIPIIGWCLENIVVTNVQQIVGMVTNSTVSTNFTFTPTQAGNYALAAAPVLFTQFPLGWGPFKLVTAITNPTPTIVLGQPVLTNNQVLLNFTVNGGSATTFHLLQTTNLIVPWTTNSTATFTTNIPGSSYRFTAHQQFVPAILQGANALMASATKCALQRARCAKFTGSRAPRSRAGNR